MTQTRKTSSNNNTHATGAVSDAVHGNWVDRVAPPFARPFLRLSRADRPIGTWLLFIPCVWGVFFGALEAQRPLVDTLWVCCVCALGAWLMRGAGCTWNDFTDRDFDAQVERTRSRPLPSGQVSAKAALIWMAAQAALALGLLLTLAPLTIFTALGSIGFVLIYPFAKRFTWWPQVFLGLAFNWGVWVGYVEMTGTLGVTPAILYAAGIIWTLFYDTIYAYQDIEDDALIGVKSTARRFGDHPRPWLASFIGGVSGLLMIAILTLPGASWSAVVLMIIGVAAMTAHLVWQLYQLELANRTILLALFRSNRNAGLCLAAGTCAAILIG